MPNLPKEPGEKKTHNMKVLLDDAQYALVQSAAKEAYGIYLVGCSEQGAEDLNLSNPGDYPLEEFEEPEFEIVEEDDDE